MSMVARPVELGSLATARIPATNPKMKSAAARLLSRLSSVMIMASAIEPTFHS